jgi:Zn-dependent protease with chaperone function
VTIDFLHFFVKTNFALFPIVSFADSPLKQELIHYLFIDFSNRLCCYSGEKKGKQFIQGLTMFCTNCGHQTSAQAKFCPQCGQPVQAAPPQLICVKCNTPLPPQTSVCPSCNEKYQHCRNCGGFISSTLRICPHCKFLLKAPVGYGIRPQEFQHPSMGQVNQLLYNTTILRKFADHISTKIGKPWYESTFTSVLSTEKQYPVIYELSGIVAQRLGLPKMPPVYIEMEHGYQSGTYGSEKDAFVNVGSFIPRLLNHKEMLFILGHEFGHLVSNHALWTTVSMFMVGQHRSTLMSDGILSYLNPQKWIESGVEAVITKWMQVADFTADRAGLLVIGDFELARRALFLLYVKSRREAEEINIEEWASQYEGQASTISKISQLTSSTTPYLSVRLKELKLFYQSPQYQMLRNRIESGCGLDFNELYDEKGWLKQFKRSPAAQPASMQTGAAGPLQVPKVKVISGSCPKCNTRLNIPLEKLPDKNYVEITCPHCADKFGLDLAKILGKVSPQTEASKTERLLKPPLVQTSPKNEAAKNETTQGEILFKKATAEGKRKIDSLQKEAIQKGPTKIISMEKERLEKGKAKPESDKKGADKMRMINGKCPKCSKPFSVPLEKLPNKPIVDLQCNGCQERFKLVLTKIKDQVTKNTTGK